MPEQKNNLNLVTGDHTKSVVEIDDIQTKEGEDVVIEGMIQKIRKLGQITFVIVQTVRDRIQGILERENMNILDGINDGDFVRMSGTVVQNPEAYKGTELRIRELNKLSGPASKLPISVGKKTNLPIEQLLDNRILTLRIPEQRAIFKMQEGIGQAFREFLSGQRFTEIHSPKILQTATEGGADMFGVNYFGQKAFLAQSPQFYKQFMIPTFGRVFEVAPAFRAEKHNTSRHLNEFTSMDFEMGFIDSFEEVMQMLASYIKYMLGELKEKYEHEISLLKVELPEFGEGIPSVSFSDAKEIAASILSRPISDPLDIEPEEERVLCEYIKRESGSDFVFITNYPTAKRPFYTMPSEDNPIYTEGFDLLVRGLEISTGGQRIHNYDMQVESIRRKGLNPDDFKAYLDLHKYGVPPHGGCGVGLERLTMKILGKDNVREATLFPRDRKRLTP